MKKFTLNSIGLACMFVGLTATVIVLFISNQQLSAQNHNISMQLTMVVENLNKVEQQSIDIAGRVESIEQQLKPDLHNLLTKN